MAHYRASIDVQQLHSTAAGTRVAHDADLTLKGQLGLVGTDTIAVLIVEPSGLIRACKTDGFEERKAERLAAALAPKRSLSATAA